MEEVNDTGFQRQVSQVDDSLILSLQMIFEAFASWNASFDVGKELM